MKLMSAVLLLCLSVVAVPCLGQERFDSGPFEGFTKSPNEHIIVQLKKPFEVKEVKGFVSDPTGAALSNVLVELKSKDGKIRGTTTKGCLSLPRSA